MISWKALLTVKKPSSQILVITGELYSSDLHSIGSSSTATMDFTIKLYPSMTSDSILYSESFLTQNNQAITVTDGKFSIRMGEGNATGDLVDVIRNNSNIFVSFSISRPGGNPETLNRRVPLTASPYALSSLPQILKGNVEPNNAAIEAPIGTHYVQTGTGDTYIKTLKSWVKLGN